MTYSLEIRDSKTRQRNNWWSNFTKSIREEKFGTSLNFPVDVWFKHRTEILEKYNAVYDGQHLHFTDEQDAIYFILRWS